MYSTSRPESRQGYQHEEEDQEHRTSADERTQLLPRENEPYLSPDDPAVRFGDLLTGYASI